MLTWSIEGGSDLYQIYHIYICCYRKIEDAYLAEELIIDQDAKGSRRQALRCGNHCGMRFDRSCGLRELRGMIASILRSGNREDRLHHWQSYQLSSVIYITEESHR